MSPTQRRQPTFTDKHTDLPPWVRFGARLLEYNGSGFDTKYEPRTVVGFTKTQIICVEGHDPDRSEAAEVRYRRPTLTRIALGTMYDGNSLVNPNAEPVRNQLAAQALDRLYRDVARLHREQITHANREDRPQTVQAVIDRLDQLTKMLTETTNTIFGREAEATAALNDTGEE